MILLQRLRTQNFKQLTDVSLRFPERGTVLIEGLNEAGKSSLFEAVFFALYGRPLLTDRDYSIADLKSYGADEMRVELDFSIDGRPFSMSRRVGANQTASLVCPSTEGQAETIRTVTAIRDRLMEEMRLSAAALLNTCFVEQKGLERLESLDARSRRDTVNELLNLRVLTALEEEYRLSRGDYDRIEELRQRVQIAQLDADLPRLRNEALAAHRCLIYRRILSCVELMARLQNWIADAKARLAAIVEQRAAIRTALDSLNRLKARIQAIAGDLTVRVRAWRQALGQQHSAEARAQELEVLVQQIPAEEARLLQWELLRDRLETLEGLEVEAVQARAALQEATARIVRWDQVEREWLEEEQRRRDLAERREQAEVDLVSAEGRLEARASAARRSERLALLLQHIAAWRRARQGVAELTSQLERARTQASLLDAAQSRVAALQQLESRVRQEERDRQELSRISAELDRCRKTVEDATQRSERIGRLHAALEEANYNVEVAGAAEHAAQTALRQAEARVALADWAEAVERCEESDPGAGRLGELETQQGQAAERLEAAKRQEHTVLRQLQLAAGGAAFGLLLTAGGVAIQQVVTLGAVGLLVMVAGAVAALLLVRSLGVARTSVTQAQSSRDALEGERRAVEGQARAAAAQRERWQARLRECREILVRLGVEIPTDAATARLAIARLPEVSVQAAQEHCRAAGTAAAQVAADREITSRSLGAERVQAADLDLDALHNQIAGLERSQGEHQERVRQAADLPTTAQALGLGTISELPGALQAARRQEADSAAAAETIHGLEHQAGQRAETETGERAQAGQLAEELRVAGRDPDTWAEGAQTEREAYSRDLKAVPDVVLENQVKNARRVVQELQQEETRLEAEQLRRRKELDLVSRETLVKTENQQRDAVAANVEAQQPLAAVRSELQSAGLPVDSPALRTRLAVVEDTLERHRTEVSTLPAVRAELERSCDSVTQNHQELIAAWSLHLRTNAPSTPDAAERELQREKTLAQQDLDSIDETHLLDEDQRLTTEAAEIDRKHATWSHQRDEASAQQTSFLAQLSELGVSVEAPSAEVPKRYPELAEAGHLEAHEWESELLNRQETIRSNLSERRALARPRSITDEPLELEAEQQALAETERDLAVKRRASEIVAQTRQSIVNRVMPLTMQNMHQILPLLTEGRYQDAKWDEQGNAISVYDCRAGDFQRKRVFSGGARDQISLALRLAFALATLPGEHNVRPGWLFLDEPLSSFDHARTQALVDLVTQGLLRGQFGQIFLISHSQSFDPGQFDYRIRMDGGEVVECNLPT